MNYPSSIYDADFLPPWFGGRTYDDKSNGTKSDDDVSIQTMLTQTYSDDDHTPTPPHPTTPGGGGGQKFLFFF